MTVDPQRQKRVKRLCNQALDLDRSQRSDFLNQACGDDDSLRREVLSLLVHHKSGEEFMAEPAWRHVVRDITTAETESLAGCKLGRYEIHEQLGRGGMGHVWRAADPQLKRDVAIKILPAEFGYHPERVRRFEQEAYAVSALNHANIITIHEIGVSDGLHFIVTELVPGQTLRERLAGGALGWRAAVRIVAQIASGLSAAHAAGIIHRDVKPENVIVQADGHVKVLDFGIAKWLRTPTQIELGEGGRGSDTRIGARPGTLKYMSPEQVVGERLDARTDVFSLGLVLYELIAGHHPHADMTDEQVVAALKSATEIPSISTGSQVIPAALDRIVTRALRKDPADRYPSASEMLADLNELKSLIEVSRQGDGQKLFRAQNANRLLTQFAVLFDLDKKTRVPLNVLWTVWRFADLKGGRLEAETVSKSLVSGVTRIGFLALAVAAITLTVAAVKSVNQEWTEQVMRDGHTAAVRRAVFSPDGRLLVSVGEDKQVIVWDFARRERLKTFTDHTATVNVVAFSPDGRWFATGGDDQSVIVWDARRLEKLAVLREHRAPIDALAFSPDNQMLLSASTVTVICETGSWKKIRELPWTRSYGDYLFLTDKRELVDNSGSVRDLKSGQLIEEENAEWAGNWAAISPDGKSWASVDASGSVRFVDLARKRLLSVQRVHYDHGRGAAFSPDGKWLATAAERVLLWDAASRTIIAPLEYESIVWSVAFSPDGRWLVSTHGDGAILVWDVLKRERTANLREHSAGVRGVTFSSDGKLVATASDDQSVIIWDAQQGQKQIVLIGHHSRVNAVSFSPNNKWLASADQDGTVIRWNLEQRAPQLTIRAPAAYSYCVVISPDERWIATTHGVYDSESGAQLLDLVGEWGAVYGIAFTPDGRQLVSVTDHGWVILWDTQTWRMIDKQRWTETSMIAVSLSPDGKTFATGEDGTFVRLGKLNPLRQVAVLGKHEARIKSVTFSPDGASVASAGDDKMIALWDLGRRQLDARIGTHTSPIYGIAFSPDGKQIISGEHDRSVRLYTRHRTLWGFRLD